MPVQLARRLRRPCGGHCPWLAAAPVALVCVAGVALAPAAAAHDDLVDSSPRVGSVLPQAPAAVELEFAGELVSASVKVVDGCGHPVTSTVTTEGRVVRAEVAVAEVTDARGSWTVGWVTIGGDGHEVDGEMTFVVEGTPDCSAVPASSPDDTTTEIAAAGAALTTEPDSDGGVAGSAAADSEDRPTVSNAPLFAGGVVLLAGAGAVIASRLRLRRPDATGA